MKREALDFVADSPFYTKRFAYYVGWRCRTETVAAVATELRLDWDSVKALDKQYMTAQWWPSSACWPWHGWECSRRTRRCQASRATR